MSQRVTFPSHPATFGQAGGALVLPPGEQGAPAVIVLQEFWGLTEHIISIAERWAAEGFVALAPDLYRGELTTDRARASALMAGLDSKRALADIAGALAYLRAHPRVAGKVGLTGYCMGGAYAFAAAAALPGVGAVVPFYGVPPSADWSKVTAPVMAHFAKDDGWAKPAIAEDIQRQITAHGGRMQLFVYDAPHAFCNDTRADVYSPSDAKLAWSRTVGFLRTHLAG